MEIGCGTGLFLFPVIPFCQYYIGTDIAQQGLTYIQDQLDLIKSKNPSASQWAQVELQCRSAENFEGIEKESLDLIVLNSVVQYFPGWNYLKEVLLKAVEAVKPGGHILLGDIRNLPALEAFYSSVEFYKARETEPDITRERLNRKVMSRQARENELVVDPAFFTALKEISPRIVRADALLKRGNYSNELIDFRYDVIIRVGEPGESQKAGMEQLKPLVKDWYTERLSLDEVRNILQQEKPTALEITRVVNSRTAFYFHVLDWMNSKDPRETLTQFLESGIEDKDKGINPEDIMNIGTQFSYSVKIKPCGSFTDNQCESDRGENGEPGRFYDVIFYRHDIDELSVISSHYVLKTKALSSYVNNPLLVKATSELVPQLRDYLKEALPEYMVPTYFIPLESFPVTSSGKLDRKVLPVYEPTRSGVSIEQAEEYIKPQTNTEKFFVDIWKEILLIEKIGINDNFFKLGGDSINVIQVISRVNKRGYSLTVRDLYQNMTVAELARYADRHQLELALAGETAGINKAVAIDKEEILRHLPQGTELEDIYPLSPFQGHMLKFLLKNPSNSGQPGLYVNQIISKIKGQLDISMVKRLFQDITDAYPYLRTAFIWENLHDAFQLVYKKVSADFQYHDWSMLADEEKEKRVNDFITYDRERGFERDKPIVYRVSVLKIAGEECVLLRTSDLMRVDGWSAQGLMVKFNEYAASVISGQSIDLKSESIYREYLNWVVNQGNANGEAFWKEMAKDLIVPTPLCLHAPGNVVAREDGFEVRQANMGMDVTDRIDSFLKQNQLVLSVLGIACWALLQSRYTSLNNIVTGVVFSGRSSALPGIDTMIGQAMNILPVALCIPEEKNIIDWLRETWKYFVDVNQYETNQQDIIRQWWEVSDDVPLFESYFVLENFPGFKEGLNRSLRSGGGPGYVYTAQMEYPLRLEMLPSINIGIAMQFYKRNLLASSVERMMSDFQSLILRVIENPNQTVAQLKESIPV